MRRTTGEGVKWSECEADARFCLMAKTLSHLSKSGDNAEVQFCRGKEETVQRKKPEFTSILPSLYLLSHICEFKEGLTN
jgi:hypothetical protein